MKNILITGGSGLVGQNLTKHLLKNNYHVAHLSRRKNLNSSVKTFLWDIENNAIDPEALIFADYVIHLAGAGLFEKAWTDKYKKEIIDSRVNSAAFLFNKFKSSNHKIKGFISASGISIYGQDTKAEIVSETSPAAHDFLADVVKKWESAADMYLNAGIRTVKYRIGIVLSQKGGALEKMLLPIRLNLGSPIGSGEQYLSWIHIEDLCRIFQFAIEKQDLEGAFNATSPNPCTNAYFTSIAAKILNKITFLPAVPSFILNVILGKEKAALAVGGNKVSSKQIQEQGFTFKYETIKSALENLLLV